MSQLTSLLLRLAGLASGAGLFLASLGTAQAGTFYVDARAGDDQRTGLSPADAWRSLEQVNRAALQPGDVVLFKRGEVWRGSLVPRRGREGAPVTYRAYGQGARPLLLGSVPRDQTAEWRAVGEKLWAAAGGLPAVDVGNIIFDHGRAVGVKKWRREDVRRPLDYWYDAKTNQVLLGAERNPAEEYRSIEFALKRHVVNQSQASYVVYEDLAVKYGAAHGFGGASTHHIVIRHCDVAWIGGGHQLTTPEGRPVRFGNGIEFWSNAHDNVVEGCRLWEIYDAALTNQGDADNTEARITYRHNVIWNCEYSFEYWNGKKSRPDAPQRSRTHDIHFEYNTCVNAGQGWGHAQRPDRNGRHLMFYHNPVETRDFYVRNNIFYQATDSVMRLLNDWTPSLTMDHNCWYQAQGPLVLFLKTAWLPAQWAEYRRQTGLDAHSVVADPQFVAVAERDFRLAPGSPARRLSTEGGPVGAQQRLTE